MSSKTTSGSGSSRVFSKALKAAGYKVAANYAGNDAAAEKFKAENGIPVYKWDVSSFEACAAGVKQVEADLGPIEAWGLELRHRHVLVDRTMRTNRPRVFAAGDIADYDGKVKLISIGFGEAALAVNHIAATVRPGTSLTPGHSSDL